MATRLVLESALLDAQALEAVAQKTSDGDWDLASVARLLSHRTRAAMVTALMSGVPATATDLARSAHVTRPTASEHLAKLVAGGLITATRQGRHRYYRLADAEIARTIETVGAIVPPRVAADAKERWAAGRLREARSCYDHLAGRLGVLVTDALVARGALTATSLGFEIGLRAAEQLAALGVDLDALRERSRAARRPLTRACLDWSERRPHLAGSLGAALLASMLDAAFVERVAGSRALRITARGRAMLRERLGIRLFAAGAAC